MTRTKIVSMVVLAAACIAGTQAAEQTEQNPPAERPVVPLMLLQRPELQEELKLDEEQRRKTSEIMEEYRTKVRESLGSFRGLEDEERAKQMAKMRETFRKTAQEMQNKLKAFLKPPQLERLKQISIQYMGAVALSYPEVTEQLNLSDDQTIAIAEALQDRSEQLRSLPRSRGRGSAERTEIVKAADEAILAKLTDEQKSQFEELKGEPFDVAKLRRTFGGPPPAFGRRRNQTDEEAAKEDLAKIQGKWGRTHKPESKYARSVKIVDGNQETLTRYDQNGEVVSAHRVEFKLEVTDTVRIFTFFNFENTAGPRKGYKTPEGRSYSYIYTLDEDEWVQVNGVLANQRGSKPSLYVWNRVTD